MVSKLLIPPVLMASALLSQEVLGFNSGSTGEDGALAPTANVQLQVPPSGVFNFTTITIPQGVTVTFQRNQTNTPVVMLASGNVVIGGIIDVSGGNSPATGTADNGVVTNDGKPGIGGPGGYDGGYGGNAGERGGSGLGPGAGASGTGVNITGCGTVYYGLGGAYSLDSDYVVCGGGKAYGSSQMTPLVGGSGGGGGWGGTSFRGSGGGGGGGAILIASSSTITFQSTQAQIWANGGIAGSTAGVGPGYDGGGGSGGAIRLVSTAINGSGYLHVLGGGGRTAVNSGRNGRVRVEAEAYDNRLYAYAATSGYVTAVPPGPVFIAGLPGLRITKVAGLVVPNPPSGKSDVIVPESTANPVSVEFETNGVPPGNTVRLTVTPQTGGASSVFTPALVGDTTKATATVAVNLPDGVSVLMAQTTYTIIAAQGDLLAPFAQGERVEKVRLTANLMGKSKAYLITGSGREFEVDPRVLALLQAG